MTQRNFTVALLAILLILAGRYATSWRQFPVTAATESTAGDRFEAIKFPMDLSWVFRIDGKTRVIRRLTMERQPISQLLLDQNHQRLYVLDATKLQAINPIVSKDRTWALRFYSDPKKSTLLWNSKFDIVVLIGPSTLRQSPMEKQNLRVIRGSDGNVLYWKEGESIDRVVLTDDRIVCHFEDRIDVIEKAGVGVQVTPADAANATG